MVDTAIVSGSVVINGVTYSIADLNFSLSGGTTPPSTGQYFDDFASLDSGWVKLNDQPSTEPWLIGTFGGRSVLRKLTSKSHGFYKNLANGETEGGVIPVLYRDNIGGSPMILANGFEVSTTVGWEIDAPLGQIGFVILPKSEIVNNPQNFKTYIKHVYEYSFSSKIVVSLKETNDLDERNGQDLVVPLNSSVTGDPMSLEMRTRVVNGAFSADYRLEGATTWINMGTSTLNFPLGTEIAVGLYCEEDHITTQTKYGWWDKILIKQG